MAASCCCAAYPRRATCRNSWTMSCQSCSGAACQRKNTRACDCATICCSDSDKMTGGKIIDPKTFWRTLGQRAIGSTIVTARSRAGAAGFLGLSAPHTPADPPLMLVSIDKRTAALAAVLASRHFAVNFLPHDARALAESFGGKGELKGAARFAARARDLRYPR